MRSEFRGVKFVKDFCFAQWRNSPAEIVSEVLLNDVNFGTCNHNNSGIIRARERVLVENVCHFVCG